MTTADVAVPSPPPRRRRRRRDPNVPRRQLRGVLVLFVLSMPIESLKFSWMPETLTFTKILGYVFIVLSLMQRRVVFRRPRPAVVFFGIYGLVIALFGVTRPAPGGASYLMQLIQWLTLLWAASNLLTGADLRRSTLFAFYVGFVSC